MDALAFAKNYMTQSQAVKSQLLANAEVMTEISRACELVTQTYEKSKKILIAGNGGSAADSQHIAAEFVSRFYFDRPGLPAIALTTDTSMLTAIGNDYGFEHLFARQVQAQGARGDVLIGISTSGNSKNVIAAVEEANHSGIRTIGLSGVGGALGDIVDIPIRVPSSLTPLIQECHICIGHIICAFVEEQIFGELRENV